MIVEGDRNKKEDRLLEISEVVGIVFCRSESDPFFDKVGSTDVRFVEWTFSLFQGSKPRPPHLARCRMLSFILSWSGFGQYITNFPLRVYPSRK